MISRKKIYNVYYIILLLICFLPTWFQIGGHIASSTLLIILMIALLLTEARGKSIIRINNNAWTIIFWLLIADLLYVIHENYSRAITLTVLVFVIFSIARKHITNEKSFIKSLDLVIFLSTYFLGVFGIIESLTGWNIFSLLNNSNALLNTQFRFGINRCISFTTQTTHYAFFVSYIIILIIYRLNCKNIDRLQRSLLIFCLIIEIVNLIFTGSRVSFLCIAVAVFVILLRKGTTTLLKILFSVLILGLFIFVFFPKSFIANYILMMISSIFKLNLSYSGVAYAEALNPYGDRFRLYGWVYDKVKNNLLLGMGEKNAFEQRITVNNGTYIYDATKTSIEVEYLYQLYYFGMVGLLNEIVFYMKLMIDSVLQSKKRKSLPFESKIDFNFIFFVISIFNFIGWFGIMQGEELNLLIIVISIWAAYNRLLRNKMSSDRK